MKPLCAFPIQVYLRNHQSAVLQQITLNTSPFYFFGTIGEEPSLWLQDGSWREDGQAHPLDIAQFITASGQLMNLKK